MSAKFQYPAEAMNPPDLQIWNNAAFDNGEFQDSSISWCVNRTDSSVSNCSSKENGSVVNPNCAIERTKIKSIKAASEQNVRDAKKIDIEIEEIEKQMNLLASRLHVLKLEKAEQTIKSDKLRGGRIVQARFMEKKDSVKENNGGNSKKIEEKWVSSAKSKVGRRGVSMCPGEIRGGSLHRDAGIKSRQLYKTDITLIKTIENRRKSCFWKLQDVDELKVFKSTSLSPKSKNVVGKIQGVGGPRQAVTTIGSRKAVKKDDGVLAAIQPKKLFEDGEKSATAKKPMKGGRVVASRYNQSTVQSAMRKRSLPENDKDDKTRCGRKRSASVGNLRGAMPEMSGTHGSECRVKKRWDVQSESVICGDFEAEKSPLLTCVVPAVLPKIRTARHIVDTPRDSGPAKRVVQLTGKKSYFVNHGDVESSVCQELSFADGE